MEVTQTNTTAVTAKGGRGHHQNKEIEKTNYEKKEKESFMVKKRKTNYGEKEKNKLW